MNQQLQFPPSKFYSMNGNTQDPLTLKLRATLFQLRKKGLSGIKRNCVQGPLLGVTLMAKRYKSKRHFEQHQNSKTNRERDENEFKAEIFRRLASKNRKKSTGLEIAKAVFHTNQPKKSRFSTQRSADSTEENHMYLTAKDSFSKTFARNRKALATHRQNCSDLRLSFGREPYKTSNQWHPHATFTQLIDRKYKHRDKMRSMEANAQRLDSIEGWNVDYDQENDFA